MSLDDLSGFDIGAMVATGVVTAGVFVVAACYGVDYVARRFSESFSEVSRREVSDSNAYDGRQQKL